MEVQGLEQKEEAENLISLQPSEKEVEKEVEEEVVEKEEDAAEKEEKDEGNDDEEKTLKIERNGAFSNHLISACRVTDNSEHC